MTENEDIVLIKMLIESYPYNFSQQNITLRRCKKWYSSYISRMDR